MIDSIENSRVSPGGNAGWIVHILRSRELEGAEGLYFRVAHAAASMTGAKHAVVVLPCGPDALRVAGCHGLPTKELGEFSVKRGIIGREFRTRFSNKPYLIVANTSQDADYYAFDDHVRSELLVPIFDADRKTMIGIVNVEAHQKGHFTQKHAETVFAIGEVMAEHREHLLRMRDIENQNAQLRLILEKIPDELLIIDEGFRPLYANEVKRGHFEELNRYLKGSTGDVWHRLFAEQKAFDETDGNTCHRLIENKLKPCPGCVCSKAMSSERPVQGIVYRPRDIDAVVEVSATPFSANGKRCIELVRYVTQREKVLEIAPQILEDEDWDQNQFLQDAVDRLHRQLGYDRVRLYSLRKGANLLTGWTYAGAHNKMTKMDFSQLKIDVPDNLRPILSKTKAGLMSLEGSTKFDDCYGYWSVGLSRSELPKFIDPKGDLELEDVMELAVVPLSTREDQWLLFLDSKNHLERRFTSDDLQALTVFSRIASATMETVRQNEMRFRYAALGKTAVGLRHTLAKFMKPEHIRTQMLMPLHRLLEKGQEYIRLTPKREHREVLALVIGLLARLSHEQDAPPPKGRCVRWVNELAGQLQKNSSYVPDEDILYELARLGSLSEKERHFWSKTITETGDDVLWRLTGEMTRLVIMMMNQAQATNELDVLSRAMSAITETGEGIELPAECSVSEVLSPVLLSVERDAKDKHVQVRREYYPEPLVVEVKRGLLFLTLLELLQNAVDAAGSREGNGWVSVSTTVLPGSSEAVISISNSGPLISEESRLKFETTAVGSKMGRGLGVGYVRDWIKANNGTVRCKADPVSKITSVSVMLRRVRTIEASSTKKEDPVV